MNNEPYLEIRDNANVLIIEALRRTHPDADNDWDRNWIHCKIEARAGAFKGNFHTNLMTKDFEILNTNLKAIYEDLNGMALFQPIDGPLEISFEGDGIGHVMVDVIVRDDIHSGNELRIHMNIDQTDVQQMLMQLNQILSAFPVQGLE